MFARHSSQPTASCYCPPRHCRCIFPSRRRTRTGGLLMGGIFLAVYAVACLIFVDVTRIRSADAAPLSRVNSISTEPDFVSPRLQSDAPLPPTASARRADHRAAGIPVGISIRMIDLAEAPVVRIGIDATTRELQAPRDFQTVGWYAAGPRPGEVGPAVLAGHLDSRTGPGVFARLHELRFGDLIEIRDARGRLTRFSVTRMSQHAKDSFPTDAVYSPTKFPTLRLITCGGEFDRDSGHYSDNLIVYAVKSSF